MPTSQGAKMISRATVRDVRLSMYPTPIPSIPKNTAASKPIVF